MDNKELTEMNLSPVQEAMRRLLDIDIPVEEPVYLSEYNFRKTWFPMFMRYFAGHKDGIAAAWATNVAGNFFKEVKVVEDMSNPENTILFTVPALLSNKSELYSPEVSVHVSEIVKQAELSNKAFPGSGDKLLQDALITSLNPGHVDTREEQMWKTIYRYYKVDAPFVSGTTNNDDKPESMVAMDYDDDF